MQRRVEVYAEELAIEVRQSAKTVWTASGNYKGQHLVAKGRSENTAVREWCTLAKHRAVQ